MVVYFAARDPRTPLSVRLLAFLVAAYALSPIDLIPDFIPVVGYLDDLILVPLGILLVLKLLPPPVLASAREKSDAASVRPTSKAAGAFVIGMWLVGLAILIRWYTS
jgi:uncharacterized membrane protein YkvA (DUF1232 family)